MSSKSNKLRQRKSEGPEPSQEEPSKKEAGSVSKKKRVQVPPATRSSTNRMWTRTVLIFCLMAVVYVFSNKEKETRFALQKENIPQRFQKFACSPSYLSEINQFSKCVPQTCGRLVTDTLLDSKDVRNLLEIAKAGISLGGSYGGASILDLHSGALSKGEGFTSIYKIPEAKGIFKKHHILSYQLVKAKIRHAIAERFRISEESLHLTHPTFFSRIDNSTARIIHDEYWHEHVDKETYSSFHYTSLLYLNDFGKDFTGGRFIFVDGKDKNRTTTSIEPKQGRVSAFTSGAENVHHVEKVSSGTRFAITISFTCDPQFAVDDPKFKIDEDVDQNSTQE